MRKFQLLFILILIIGLNEEKLSAQNIEVKAIIKDNISKNILEKVYLLNETNFIIDSIIKGRKNIISINKNSTDLKLFKTNYAIKNITVSDLNKDTIYLNPIQERLSEIIINSQRQKTLLNLETGLVFLDKKTIKNLPTFLGDQDVLKSLSLSPGIQQAMEGQSNFFVRGGNASMNYFELDKMYLHQINHLGGLYNAINSDMLESVKLYKSSFDAQFGNRLSSITEMKTLKKPDHLNGKIVIGLLATKGLINIPINNSTSLLISARRTYLDILKNSISDNNENSLLHKNSNYSFYDYYIKLNKNLNTNNLLNFKIYNSRDNYLREKPSVESFKNGHWTNFVYGVDWTSNISKNTKNNLQFNFSEFAFNFSESFLSYDYDLKNFYKRLTIENTLFHNYTNSQVNFGVSYNSIENNPKNINAFYNGSLIDIKNSSIQNASIFSIYGQVKTLSYNNLNFKIGGRLTHYNYGSKITLRKNSYLKFDPRITLNYNINPNASLKFSYQSINQFVHQTTITSFNLPSDFYLLSNSVAKPQYNHLLNLEVMSFFKNFNITSGLYYNRVFNFSELKNGTLNNLFNENLYNELVFGELTSYGVEIGINSTFKNSNASINYTFSNTKVHFSELNNGNPFRPIFDRPHNINIALSHELNSKIKLGALFMLMSGQNYNEPTAIRILEELPILEYNNSNNSRFPSYHRLDLSLDYILKKNKQITSKLNFTIYNSYNRKNPFYINYETIRNDNTSISVSKENQYLFPIIPSISWLLTFK